MQTTEAKFRCQGTVTASHIQNLSATYHDFVGATNKFPGFIKDNQRLRPVHKLLKIEMVAAANPFATRGPTLGSTPPGSLAINIFISMIVCEQCPILGDIGT